MGEVVQLRQVLDQASGTNSLSTTQSDFRCPKCRSEVEPVEILIQGRQIKVAPLCQDCVKAEAIERAREAQLERKARIQALFDMADLGPRFQTCTFDSWRQKPLTGDWYGAASDYAARWDEHFKAGQGLLVFGPPGNGKTHLAAAIVNDLIQQKQVTCIFRSVPTLLAKLRATYNPEAKTSEHEIMDALRDADLLVLDDFGAEKLTEWAEATLYSVIDERYRWLRPVIITTNCGLDEFAQRIGLRSFDRILEMCAIVKNDALSFRQQQAKARITLSSATSRKEVG